MSKKGQLLGMPLVMIFGMIVAALILFFGVRWVMDIQSEGDYVSMLDVIEDIENTVETYGNYDEGSAKVYDISLPKKIEKLCFYLADSQGSCYDDGQACSTELTNYFSLAGDDAYNVYIYPSAGYDMSRFAIESFQPEGGNPLCVSNGDSILITAYKDYVGIAYYE